MSAIFIKILNMSYITSYVILAIIVIRLFFKKSPKIFSYILWVTVFIRSIFPFSFKSKVSLMYVEKDFIHTNIKPVILNNITNGISSSELISVVKPVTIDYMDIVINLGTVIWILGVLVISLYSLLSYIKFLNNFKTATIIEPNIFETDRIETPFVLGIIKPKIYLPIGVKDKNYDYILCHEKVHIARKDYIIKPLYFMVVIVYWFNPLIWLSYYLMTKDMEMACDEKVMELKGYNIKFDYASLLLNLSESKSTLFNGIAFGKNNTKLRIKNILKYKKPKFWIISMILIVIIILFFALITNPLDDEIKDLGNKESRKESSEELINDKPDLVKNIAEIALLNNILIVDNNTDWSVFFYGKNFSNLLYNSIDSWKEIKISSTLEDSSDLSIYMNWDINLEEIYFYNEDSMAVIRDHDNYIYYDIPNDLFEKVNMILMLSSSTIDLALIDILISDNSNSIKSDYDIPNNIRNYYSFSILNQMYYIYEKNNIHYCEAQQLYIKEISEEIYNNAIELNIVKKYQNEITDYDEVKKIVEENLSEIMSSPKYSSIPLEYILAHGLSYEKIIKYGGESGLTYMLNQFEIGKADGLRGELMMILCKELLGVRNNVKDETLSSKDWFNLLEIRKKINLPDYEYEGDEVIEKLVYEEITKINTSTNGSFLVVALDILESVVEDNKLKVFAIVELKYYKLYDNILSNEGGRIIPVAITYVKNSNDEYILESYEEAGDGANYYSSIKDFSSMPVSRKKIDGLSEKFMSQLSDLKDISNLGDSNLIKHLIKHNQNNIFLLEQHYDKPDEMIPII